MTTIRDVVYLGAYTEGDDDGRPIISLEAAARLGGNVRIELTPEQAEELVTMLMDELRSIPGEVE